MNNNIKSWTVIDILKTTTEYFSNKNIENPRLNAERLLSFALKMNRLQLYLQFERILTSTELKQYRELVLRRASYEPLQYILGETEFMGLTFKVTPDVLIPRPETEILIEKVLDLKENYGNKEVSFLDIGTGSGCIAISLAYYWPNCKITATDVSQAALNIADENSRMNNVSQKINFINHDILSSKTFPIPKADIIVSNPPYIPVREMENLDNEICKYEPHIALTDGKDGMHFYEKILRLIDIGFNCKFIFMELNAAQSDNIYKRISKFRFTDITVIPDLNNLPRILKIKTF